MPLRIGIVGLSIYYARAFAEALVQLPEADLRGACSLGTDDDYSKRCIGLTHAEYAEQFGVRIYDDISEMVESEALQSVAICGETPENGDLTARAAALGMDVYICKPMANSIADARKSLNAATAAGVLLSACNPARGEASIRQAKVRLDDGEIGDLISLRTWIQHNRRSMEQARSIPWYKPKSGIGLEYGIGFYNADLINWLSGYREIDRVFAEYSNQNTPGTDERDTGKGIVRFKDGLAASFDSVYSTTFPSPLWEVELIGTKGMIRTNHAAFEGAVYGESGAAVFQRDHAHVSRVFITELGRWIKACLDRTEPDLPAEQGVRAIELCVAWDQSATSGLPVDFPISD